MTCSSGKEGGIPIVFMTDGSRKGYRHEYAGSPVDNRKDKPSKKNDEFRIVDKKESSAYKNPGADVC